MASMSSPSGSVGGRGLRAAMYRSNSKWYFVAWLVVPQIVHGPPAPVQRRGCTLLQLRQPHLKHMGTVSTSSGTGASRRGFRLRLRSDGAPGGTRGRSTVGAGGASLEFEPELAHQEQSCDHV